MSDLSWSLGDIADFTGGSLKGDPGILVRSVITDSREDVTDALYIALRGERFDGHDFVNEVQKKGVAAVLVEKTVDCVPHVLVSDTLEALQALGRQRRQQFKGPVVAITGSSGKTTTRSLLHSIFEKRYVTLQTIRNFNNHIGVPITLLTLEPKHEAAVLEIGCSDFKEIELLTTICNPDVGIITNVGPAHLECLGDLEGVAKAKGELFESMGPDAVSVVNLDDPNVAKIEVKTNKKISFGTGADADIALIRRQSAGAKGQMISLKIKDEIIDVLLPLPGVHNAQNALAAAAAAVAAGLGVEHIKAGLAQVALQPGRLALKNAPNNSLIIDDTYNANPASMKAALDVLFELEKKYKIAVLGDMLELGDASTAAHLEIGRYAANKKIDLLVTMGEQGYILGKGAMQNGLPKDQCLCARDHSDAVKLIADSNLALADTAVLVKGSRGMKMENVVNQLLEGNK